MSGHLHPSGFGFRQFSFTHRERIVRTPCLTTLIWHAPLPWHARSPSVFTSRYASNPGTSPQFLLLAAGIPQRASRRTPSVTVSVSLRSPVANPVAFRLQVTFRATLALRIARTAWLLNADHLCPFAPQDDLLVLPGGSLLPRLLRTLRFLRGRPP